MGKSSEIQSIYEDSHFAQGFSIEKELGIFLSPMASIQGKSSVFSKSHALYTYVGKEFRIFPSPRAI